MSNVSNSTFSSLSSRSMTQAGKSSGRGGRSTNRRETPLLDGGFWEKFNASPVCNSVAERTGVLTQGRCT